MTIKEAYEALLGRQLPDPSNGNPNVSIKCFCHDDTHESCSLNVENGGWYCHATGNKGYLPHAVAVVKGVTLEVAHRTVKEDKVQEGPVTPREVKEQDPIDPRVRDVYIRHLNDSRLQREYAQKKLGWNPETLQRFGIGWSPETKRYTIPVYDEHGMLRNFRMYDPESAGVNKMISWKAGYGTPARLFPAESLKAQTIIVNEGEKDCILMNQVLDRFGPDGWAAITGTGGAGTWRDAWTKALEGKDVIIIYDRDKSGETNSLSIAAKLVKVARSVKVVTLDITEPAGADITNYFQDSGKGWDDLKTLIDETENFTSGTPIKHAGRSPDDAVYEPHLSEASQDRFAYRKLKLRVMVAGKELAPFIVPRDVAFECNIDWGKPCAACPLSTSNGFVSKTYEGSDPKLVEMLRLSKYELSTFLRRDLGVPSKCPKVELHVDTEQNMEEVVLVPELEFSHLDKEYVSRTAYVSEHGVVPNQSYVMHGTTIPHPRTQHAVHHVWRSEPAQDSIDDFQMTDKKLAALQVFKPKQGQTVMEKFKEISRDLSHNVTKIYGRDDIVMGVDLCYHTVLAFSFIGKKVEKTWGDILVIGDTRTGKTETVQGLMYHYKLGEMSVGENTSFAGLVGGLKQGASRQWAIHWGRIPLNNRRLLVIDEASGLPVEVIGNMSGIRSNGIAEMVKIETQRTAARTRLVWLSNPRADKSMEQYGYGVEVVKELIGRPEDIARFDYVITSRSNEVPIEVINNIKHDVVTHVYTSDLCRELILWAWSRKADDIVFTSGTEEMILKLATSQSSRYFSGGGVPLVEGGNHRIKLAKLAVAAACRTFSTDDGEKVLVKTEHVQFAHDFLDACYQKASLDYAGWSKVRIAAREVSSAQQDEVKKWITDHKDWALLWITKDELRVDDFKTQFDLETKDARVKIFVPLTKLKMIEKGKHSTYVKTPKFIQLLKELEDAPSTSPDVSTGDDLDDIPF